MKRRDAREWCAQAALNMMGFGTEQEDLLREMGLAPSVARGMSYGLAMAYDVLGGERRGGTRFDVADATAAVVFARSYEDGAARGESLDGLVSDMLGREVRSEVVDHG